jgi:hypothetical protein
MIDDAQAPLDERQRTELDELAARVAVTGERGSGRREIEARQRRETAGCAPTSFASGSRCSPSATARTWLVAATPARQSRPSRCCRLRPRRSIATRTSHSSCRPDGAPGPRTSLSCGQGATMPARDRGAAPPAGATTLIAPARVAQSAEQLTRNEQVKGSIPFSGSRSTPPPVGRIIPPIAASPSPRSRRTAWHPVA